MRTLWSHLRAAPSGWEKVEVELLTELRQAEIEFNQACAGEKEQAGERYRRALERFSRLILDRRFPPGFQLQN